MAGILISTSEAAATLTVGTDAFRNDRKRTSSRARVVNGIAIVGSAAINDTEVDVYAGDYYFGRFRNSRAGVVAPIYPDDMQPIRATVVAAGDAITATIVDAPATNPILIQVFGQQL